MKAAKISPSEFPVSVILERRLLQRGRWTFPDWQLVGVVAGEAVAQPGQERELIHTEAGREQYLWRGFVLHLYRDAAASYWHNLMAKNPSLFVVCRDNDDGELVPCQVTADADEGAAHLEAEDTVMAVAMPAEIYQWIERYVVANYEPRETKKRKRKDWREDTRNDRHERRSG